MTQKPSQPPFAEAPQGQPAAQAATGARSGEYEATHPMAERHEALWLALAALHKDVLALGVKKLTAPVPDMLRIAAEGLLSDCVPFGPSRRGRLPVSAPDMGGLAVQLGQALAVLDAWESQRSFLDPRFKCRMWRVGGPRLPIMRLKPPAAALPEPRHNMADIREKLARLIDAQRAGDFQRGFRAGRTARQGQPLAEIEAEFQKSYPRLRLLD